MPSPLSHSYNTIATWFDANRRKDLVEKEYLDLITQTIPPAAAVLDLGCGAGEPLAKFFIERGYFVTGIDASWKMIEICKEKFSSQNFTQTFQKNLAENFFVADMRDLNLGRKFEIILAWDSFFHLTKGEQRSMFATFAAHITRGGILAFTSGPKDGEVWSDNNGEMLYHASLSVEEYRELLAKFGFEVLRCDVSDRGVWVVRKK